MLQKCAYTAVASNRIISLNHEKGQGSFLYPLYCLKKEISCTMFHLHLTLRILELFLSIVFKDAAEEICTSFKCILHLKIEFTFEIIIINCVSKEDANLFRLMHKSIYISNYNRDSILKDIWGCSYQKYHLNDLIS